jgi:hypothetical protein
VLLIHSRSRRKTAEELESALASLRAVLHPLPAQGSSVQETEELLETASHVLIIADSECLAAKSTHFALGYAAGGRLPVFLLLTGELDDTEHPSEAVCVHSVEKLKERLSDELQRWREEQERKTAAAAIERRGMPVTAEGMAKAVSEGSLELLELFFRAGFSPDTANNRGTPLLCLAVRAGQEETVYRLLEEGAEVNSLSRDRGNTPLMDAAAENNPRIIRRLLDAGAAPDIRSKNGQSALVLAVGQQLTEIAAMLLEAGADPDLKDSLGMSARAYARLFGLSELLKPMGPPPE